MHISQDIFWTLDVCFSLTVQRHKCCKNQNVFLACTQDMNQSTPVLIHHLYKHNARYTKDKRRNNHRKQWPFLLQESTACVAERVARGAGVAHGSGRLPAARPSGGRRGHEQGRLHTTHAHTRPLHRGTPELRRGGQKCEHPEGIQRVHPKGKLLCGIIRPESGILKNCPLRVLCFGARPQFVRKNLKWQNGLPISLRRSDSLQAVWLVSVCKVVSVVVYGNAAGNSSAQQERVRFVRMRIVVETYHLMCNPNMSIDGSEQLKTQPWAHPNLQCICKRVRQFSREQNKQQESVRISQCPTSENIPGQCIVTKKPHAVVRWQLGRISAHRVVPKVLRNQHCKVNPSLIDLSYWLTLYWVAFMKRKYDV